MATGLWNFHTCYCWASFYLKETGFISLACFQSKVLQQPSKALPSLCWSTVWWTLPSSWMTWIIDTKLRLLSLLGGPFLCVSILNKVMKFGFQLKTLPIPTMHNSMSHPCILTGMSAGECRSSLPSAEPQVRAPWFMTVIWNLPMCRLYSCKLACKHAFLVTWCIGWHLQLNALSWHLRELPFRFLPKSRLLN